MSQDGPNTIPLLSRAIFSKVDTLVSSFSPDLPYYVHDDVTVAALYHLVVDTNPELYFNEATFEYVRALVELFPSPDSDDSLHRVVVGFDEYPGCGKMDVSASIRPLRAWASKVLEQLALDIKLGAIHIHVSDPLDIEGSEIDLISVLH
jgi:hypothetical protein